MYGAGNVEMALLLYTDANIVTEHYCTEFGHVVLALVIVRRFCKTTTRL